MKFRLSYVSLLALAIACGRDSKDDPDSAPVVDTDSGAGQPDGGGPGPDTDAAPEIDGAPPIDAAPPEVVTLAELRERPDGPVNLQVNDVYVTYVRLIGFFVQAEPGGPATFVFTGDPPAVEVGNQIDLHVTELASFMMNKQVDAATVLDNDGGSFDVVGELAQDLSADPGTAPGEDHESELVRITGATVLSGGGRDFTVEYGVNLVEAHLYHFEAAALGLCAGATLDVVGTVNQLDDGSYRIAAYYEADVANLDLAGCTAADMSNWDLEDWTAANPPSGFENRTTMLTSTQESTLFHGGAASANLTWTSTDNQDFATLFRSPVTADTMYTCHVWAFDNDPGGRTRAYISWYRADGSFIGNSFPADANEGFTTDMGSFQEITRQATAPADAATMTCAVRLHDVAAGWDGNATVFVDDFSITTP